MMLARMLLLAAVMGGGAVGTARAHGTLPATTGLGFGPPALGGFLFGTNFGGVLRGRPDAPDLFICEKLVQGNTATLDAWLWLGSGEIVAARTQGAFAFGIYASSDGGCTFAEVPDSDSLAATDLIADPDGASFLASGTWGASADDLSGRVLRGRAGAAPTPLLIQEGLAATGVRASGRDLYAAFAPLDGAAGDGLLAHSADAGEHWESWPVAVLAGTVLRPVGVDPAHPTTVWFVLSGESGDTLLRSEDAGQTRAVVLEVAARLTGFACDGDKAWVQSPQQGTLRSDDGGKTFVELAGSPHGSCVATGPDGALYACGVPWQDGYEYGVSHDGGASFTAFGLDFDHITGPIDCPEHPESTALCADELEFLLGFYGFLTPSTRPEPGPEVAEAGPEIVESSAEPDAAEPEIVEPEVTRPGGGCASGPAALPLALAGVCLARRRQVSA